MKKLSSSYCRMLSFKKYKCTHFREHMLVFWNTTIIIIFVIPFSLTLLYVSVYRDILKGWKRSNPCAFMMKNTRIHVFYEHILDMESEWVSEKNQCFAGKVSRTTFSFKYYHQIFSLSIQIVNGNIWNYNFVFFSKTGAKRVIWGVC